MSNLEITYLGADAKQLMEDHPGMVRQVNRFFERREGPGHVCVYVYPRPVDASLEWTAVGTSPSGRRTWTIKQKRDATVVFTSDNHEKFKESA